MLVDIKDNFNLNYKYQEKEVLLHYHHLAFLIRIDKLKSMIGMRHWRSPLSGNIQEIMNGLINNELINIT